MIPQTHTNSLFPILEKREARGGQTRGRKLQKTTTHYPTLRKLGQQDHKFEASLGCSWIHLKTKNKKVNYKFSFRYNHSGFKNKQKKKRILEKWVALGDIKSHLCRVYEKLWAERGRLESCPHKRVCAEVRPGLASLRRVLVLGPKPSPNQVAILPFERQENLNLCTSFMCLFAFTDFHFGNRAGWTGVRAGALQEPLTDRPKRRLHYT